MYLVVIVLLHLPAELHRPGLGQQTVPRQHGSQLACFSAPTPSAVMFRPRRHYKLHKKFWNQPHKAEPTSCLEITPV